MEVQLSLLEDVNTTLERQAREEALAELKTEKLEEVCRYSGYRDGGLRIWAAMKHYQDTEKRIRFLRDEYGTGGHSMDGSWFVDYDSSGLHIMNLRGPERFQVTWSELMWRTVTMIHQERFLDEEQRAKMAEIIADHGGEIPFPIARYPYPVKG